MRQFLIQYADRKDLPVNDRKIVIHMSGFHLCKRKLFHISAVFMVYIRLFFLCCDDIHI